MIQFPYCACSSRASSYVYPGSTDWCMCRARTRVDSDVFNTLSPYTFRYFCRLHCLVNGPCSVYAFPSSLIQGLVQAAAYMSVLNKKIDMLQKWPLMRAVGDIPAWLCTTLGRWTRSRGCSSPRGLFARSPFGTHQPVTCHQRIVFVQQLH